MKSQSVLAPLANAARVAWRRSFRFLKLFAIIAAAWTPLWSA